MSKIEIRNGQNSTYPFRNRLKEDFGLSFKKTGKYTGVWTGHLENGLLDSLRAFCKDNQLRFIILDDEHYSRSNDYTDTFFDSNRGFMNDGIHYRCSYCGRILRKDLSEVVVDHLIPVRAVRNDYFWHKRIRQILSKYNVNNINDAVNLVPSCTRCNSSKGAKIGFWTLRGYLGRNEMFWKLLYVLLWIFGSGCVLCFLLKAFLF